MMPISSIWSNPGHNWSHQLNYLNKKLWAIVREVKSVPFDGEIDTCLLHQHEEELSSLNTKVTNALHELLSLKEDDIALVEQQLQPLSQILFTICLKVKHLLQKHEGAFYLSGSGSSVKLPKLSFPMFDGNIVNWHFFREQFTVSVHNRTNLSPSEKLTYLKHAVKDGSAKHVMDGLSAPGIQYEEAIDCANDCVYCTKLTFKQLSTYMYHH